MSYAYQGEFNEEVNANFAEWLNEKLIALQEEADPVLCEYVTTMVANRKTMGEMSSDLAEFFGEEERERFITSLEEKLLSLEAANDRKDEEAPNASKVISLSSGSSIKHDALSKPLGAGREASGGSKSKGDKPKGKKQQQQQQQQRGSRPNRLLQAAMEQGRAGVKRGNDQGGGFNKRARGSNDNDQGMGPMAQMPGFNNPNDMMMMYQQSMMTMMQSVLAPVMEATKGLVASRGGRGFVRGGRGGYPPRGRGRGGRLGAGRGEAGSSSAEGDAGESKGEDGGEESAKSNPQDGFVGDGTFDMTSGYRGGRGGRGFRGRGRFSGRFSTRGGRGRGRVPHSGPVNKVWKREPDVESSLTTSR